MLVPFFGEPHSRGGSEICVSAVMNWGVSGGGGTLFFTSVVFEDFVLHSGCGEHSRIRAQVPSFHLLSGKVKGKATGMMKLCYQLSLFSLFVRPACMCSRFPLTPSAGGNYN